MTHRAPPTSKHTIVKLNKSKSMTKKQIIREVAESKSININTATLAIEAALRVICKNLSRGETVTINGFGTFTPVQCSQRVARNFRTGTPVTVPAHRSAKFKPGKELRLRLQQPGEWE